MKWSGLPDHLRRMKGDPAKSEILWGAKFGFFAYYCWFAGILTLILTFIQK